MRIIRHISVFLLAFLFLQQGFSQPSTDEQLAQQFYQNGEFDKAAEYYGKLFNRNPMPAYYQHLLKCYVEMKDFKAAEKLVKKQVKNFPESLHFIVDLGNIYKESGDPEKAKQEYERAIKQLSPDQNQVIDLANAFTRAKEYSYAIDSYIKGRNFFSTTYPFHFELAEVYASKGDLPEMINEYLDLLAFNESYIQNVQSALQTRINGETETKRNELLKSELLKRIQRNPDKTIFSEFLIWLLIQEQSFDAAFTQARALDKRMNEDGGRIFELGKLCVSNESYDVAAKCFEYVLSKGPESYYYVSAKIELLNMKYKRLVEQHNYTREELLNLEKNISDALNELGKFTTTAPLIKKLAHLQAFFLDKTNEAMQLLEEAILIPQLPGVIQAECKLELGDILLMTGDTWEASLTYSQVEKAYKHEPVGQEAKFRNAKISYYTGDFKWAQAQLDVLKGATSKLISNDALELSLVITDNLGADSNEVAMLMFSTAGLLSFRNRDEEAMARMDSIKILFPGDPLLDDILYRKYKIMMKKSRFEEAGAFLEEILKDYSHDIIADDALFKLAELNESRFSNKEKAKELYQEVLLRFPGSIYSVEARKRYRVLRGDVIN